MDYELPEGVDKERFEARLISAMDVAYDPSSSLSETPYLKLVDSIAEFIAEFSDEYEEN